MEGSRIDDAPYRRAGRLCADGRCLLSLLFFELIQFIVIRFSIDCIVRWGSETRLMESRGIGSDAPSHWLGISHVINLPLLLSPYLLLLFTRSHITVLVGCSHDPHSRRVEVVEVLVRFIRTAGSDDVSTKCEVFNLNTVTNGSNLDLHVFEELNF